MHLPPDPEDDLSLIDQVALMPDGPDRDSMLALIATMDPNDPELVLRPSQLAVVRDESWITLLFSGRGTGKTKTGSQWVIERAREPNTRIALVGRTVSDVRDVMIQGESGILANSPADFMPIYTPTVRKLEWPNGSIAMTYSADVPSQLRGPQQHYVWCDELAAYRMMPDDSGATIWDNAVISTRLGEHPQILVTTTPKRVPIIRELARQAGDATRSVELYTASTWANRSNLSAEYLQSLIDTYAGSHLERQELYGELIGDSPGALLRSSDITVDANAPDRDDMLIIIGVDPAVEAGRDDAGIVVVGTTTEPRLQDRHVWVLEDLTINGSPDEWANIVVDAQERWSTPRSSAIVVAEGNQGAQLISLVLRQIKPSIPVAIVKTNMPKETRAEPICVAYRRHRITHVDEFPELVEEWTGWEPHVSRWSPGHLDACVWACHTAIVDDSPLRPFTPLTVLSSPHQLSLGRAIPPHRAGRRNIGMAAAPWRSKRA